MSELFFDFDQNDAKTRIKELSALLRRYQDEYYINSRPSVSDAEYDRVFNQLQELERANPEYMEPDSPTLRVGSDLESDFAEVTHAIPVLSLDKTHSGDELMNWVRKTEKTAAAPNLWPKRR